MNPRGSSWDFCLSGDEGRTAQCPLGGAKSAAWFGAGGESGGGGAECQAENVLLRDTVEFLTERLACAERRLTAAKIRKPYSLAERLNILWCIEYFGVSRRQIPKHFGVARSTVWRWLRRLQDGIGLCGRKCQVSVRRTSEELCGWCGRCVS